MTMSEQTQNQKEQNSAPPKPDEQAATAPKPDEQAQELAKAQAKIARMEKTIEELKAALDESVKGCDVALERIYVESTPLNLWQGNEEEEGLLTAVYESHLVTSSGFNPDTVKSVHHQAGEYVASLIEKFPNGDWSQGSKIRPVIAVTTTVFWREVAD